MKIQPYVEPSQNESVKTSAKNLLLNTEYHGIDHHLIEILFFGRKRIVLAEHSQGVT